MSSLDDFLRVELQGTPLSADGPSPLPSPIRPTAAGLQWLTAPSGVAGLVYRCNDTTMERIQVTEDALQVVAACSMGTTAVNMAASADGRLVVVAGHDGSLQCLDSTATSLTLRWTLPGVHSHKVAAVQDSPSADRSHAAAACGPIRSLEFAATGSTFLMVDKTTLRVYNAAQSSPTVLISQENVTSASWSSLDDKMLVIGQSTGQIDIWELTSTPSTKLVSVSQLGCPSEEDGFSCTHLDWSDDTLVAGFAKVTPSDEEPDEEDEDDTAEHEAALFITTMASNQAQEWASLGDVVPFFTVPKAGRHVFFTSCLLGSQKLVVVASNVGSDVGAVALEGSDWQVVEFQEGAAATTPTDEDDEFYFPVGIQVVQLEESQVFRLVLASTDGSLSLFSFENENDPNCFAATLTKTTASLPAMPIELEQANLPPDLTEEEPIPESSADTVQKEEPPKPAASSGFDFGSLAPAAPTFGAAPAAPINKSPFSFGVNPPASTLAPPAGSSGFSFGSKSSTTAFGSSPSGGLAAFGTGTSAPTFSFGTPTSGFGATSPLGTSAPTLSSDANPSTTPSGSTFGSTSTSTFGQSLSSSSIGFGALANSGKETGIISGDKFNAFSKPVTSPMAGMQVKPLFGSTPKAETTPAQQSTTPTSLVGTKIATPSSQPPTPSLATSQEKTPVMKADDAVLGVAGNKAAKAFDTISGNDTKEGSSLPTEKFEDLLDEIGEGFHGEELDLQIKKLDPSRSGKISRTNFIDWYTTLAEGGDDDDDDGSSLDSDERAERAEEESKARDCFGLLSSIESDGNRFIRPTDMEKLITSLGSTYGEQEFQRVLKKLVKPGDKIYESDFVAWYIEWLFGDDDGSDFEDELDDDDDEAAASSAGALGSSPGEDLSNVFKIDKDSWKCGVCSLRHAGDKKKCPACETVRPGYENDPDVAPSSTGAAASSGSIGATGFTFGGASTAGSGSIGTGGFTFSAGASSAPPAGGGFMFGASPTPNQSVDSGKALSTKSTDKVESGFKFGASTTEAATPVSTVQNTFGDKSPFVKADDDAPLTVAGNKAAKAFDTISGNDTKEGSSLPTEKFEDLLDEIGEGFHGEELDLQIKKLDPSRSGKISRTNFIDWYTTLAEGGDDDDDDGSSLDSDERAERAEEESKARDCFGLLSSIESDGNRFIRPTDMEKLITSLGSTYGEQEFQRVLKKLVKPGDKIYESDFVAWYIEWLFGDDDGSDFEDELDDDDDEAAASSAGALGSSPGEDLSNVFKIDKDSWKCGVCSLRHAGDKKKCPACETVRPGYENDPDVAPSSTGAAASSGSIGATGFTFGGASTAGSGSIGTGGFTFSAGASSAPPAGGGFMFGASPTPNQSVDSGKALSTKSTDKVESGFKFGASTTEAATPVSTVQNTFGDKSPFVKADDDAPLTVAGNKAAKAFDTISGNDTKEGSSLPTEKFEDLLDEIGEGFHGEELDLQIKKLDPSRSGKISRTNFIDWYTTLAEGGDDDDDDGSSLDSDERAERAEEESKARDCFGLLSSIESDGNRFIRPTDMEKLITSLGSTYGEQEFQRVLKKLVKPGDKIYESDFVAWYIEWLFGDDDGSDFEDELDDDDDEAAASSTGALGSSPGEDLSNVFKIDKDSWKCGVCSLRHAGDKKKCPACETVRPGYENDPDVAPSSTGAAASSGSIGATGFTFGEASATSSGSIGAGGFTFSAGASSAPPAGGGFMFGASSPPNQSVDSGKALSTKSTDKVESGFKFGASTTEAPEPASSSSTFPPMSSKAPTPFGSTAKASAPASSSSTFPPMSSKAPTPFGSTAKASAPASSSSAFPPMSSKAPTPFGSTAKASAPASSSSTFPPISSKAPTPFGSTSKASAPASSSSAFPPMSSKAPTPFGSTAKASAPASSSSTFPPMSSKAPTPFGSTAKASAPASSSSTFPPMSSKAPTPFGSTAKASAPASSSSTFPPMSSKAPTPFGSTAKASAPASSSSAFPPMSSKARTPFGSTAKASAPASSSSTFPPMSSKAPTPFGSMAKSPAPSKHMAGTSPSDSMSPSEKHFLSLHEKMNQQKVKISEMVISASKKSDEMGAKIVGLVEKRERIRSDLITIDMSISHQQEKSAFLMSRKTDSSRQVSETKCLIDYTEAARDLAENQKLDFESEQRRRSFASRARSVNDSIKMAKARLMLLSSATEAPDGTTPVIQAVMDLHQKCKGVNGVFQRLESQIEQAQRSAPLDKKSTSSKIGRSIYGLSPAKSKSPFRGRSRMQPLAFSSPGGRTVNTPTSHVDALRDGKWDAIEDFLQAEEKKTTITRLQGLSRERLSAHSQTNQLISSGTVRGGRSLLLSPTTAEKPSQPARVPVRISTSTLFSPTSNVRARSDWDNIPLVDQSKAKQISLSLPSHVKEISVTSKAREKLAAFGTTPEKVQEKYEISRSPSAKRSQSGTKNPASESRKTPEASLPPISSKSPTPFKGAGSAESAPTEKSKASISGAAAFPPMASKAPIPFGVSTKSSDGEESRRRKISSPTKTKEDSDAPDSVPNPFGDMKGLGNSLLSLDNPSSSKFPSSKSTSSATASSATHDYKKLLTGFYQKHQPDRLSSVDQILEKYKGREVEMFGRLAAKYKVQSPLDGLGGSSQTMASSLSPSGLPPLSSSSASSSTAFGSTTQVPSQKPASPFKTTDTTTAMTQSAFGSTNTPAPATQTASPFGMSTPAPAAGGFGSSSAAAPSSFGSTTAAPTASAFGSSAAPAPSPFGASSAPAFGGLAPSPSPFGSNSTGGLSSVTPFGSTSAAFGAPAAPPASPFGTAATVSPFGSAGRAPQQTFQGRNPRDLLLEFYKQKNPSKIGEIDKVLQKYQGNEEQLFRNLAKKYQLDPSVFGLSSAPPSVGFGAPAPAAGGFASSSGFGQTSSLSSGGTFGQASTTSAGGAFGQSGGGFGQPSSLGGSTSSAPTFGSAAGSFGAGAPSFGNLAASPSPFGAPAPPAFGSPAPVAAFGSTSFGAPRR